jgi:ParB family transcriptional regulator, chromosome partitioning protein
MPTKKRTVPEMRNVSAFLTPKENQATDSNAAIALSQVNLPPKQPRRFFDPDRMEQLIQSVKEHGILEPILVRPLGSGFELIAGERRYRAAKAAGLREIPAVVRDLDDLQAIQIALIENLQREDLNPVEETEAILELLAITLHCQAEEVVSVLNRANHARNREQELEVNVSLQLETIESVLLGIGRFTAETFRSTRLPLLNLPEVILTALRQGKLEYTKARAIARVPEEQQQELLKAAIEEELSLNDIKQRIRETSDAPLSREKAQEVKFSQRFTDVYKRLKGAAVWKDSSRRKAAEKLLSELEKLVDN